MRTFPKHESKKETPCKKGTFRNEVPVLAGRFFYFTELSHVVQERAEDPKALEAARPERAEAPSPGQRPGYNDNHQGAL